MRRLRRLLSILLALLLVPVRSGLADSVQTDLLVVGTPVLLGSVCVGDSVTVGSAHLKRSGSQAAQIYANGSTASISVSVPGASGTGGPVNVPSNWYTGSASADNGKVTGSVPLVLTFGAPVSGNLPVNVTASGPNVAGGTLSRSDAFTVSVTAVECLPPDTTPPAISGAPDGPIVAEATGPAGVAVAWAPLTAHDDRDGPVPVTCSPASGSTFGLGSTAVQCSAADSAGNLATVTITVLVQDTTPPVLTLPAGGTYFGAFSYTATAYDLVDGPVAVSCDSGVQVGTHSISCTAADRAGNNAAGSFTYTLFTGSGAYAGSGTFKYGSTIPFRYRLDDTVAPGARAGRLLLYAVSSTGATADTAEVVEDITTTADSGSSFRWDPSAWQYVINFKSDRVAKGKYAAFVEFDGVMGQMSLGTFTTVDAPVKK